MLSLFKAVDLIWSPSPSEVDRKGGDRLSWFAGFLDRPCTYAVIALPPAPSPASPEEISALTPDWLSISPSLGLLMDPVPLTALPWSSGAVPLSLPCPCHACSQLPAHPLQTTSRALAAPWCAQTKSPLRTENPVSLLQRSCWSEYANEW